jgi:two-component system, NtrC family, sensor histidine kinase HydH
VETLEPSLLGWVNDPKNKGRLFLGEVRRATAPPWQGRLVMPLITALYGSPAISTPEGALELLIDPLVIAQLVTAGVRSGATGYPWIIDQNGIFLAHYEKGFVGQKALEVRSQRSPHMVFTGLQELQERLLRGEEGTGGYVSGWHRQRVGETPKLAAYTPIRFDKGLIRTVTDVENPARNLWGVAVVAPVAEVAGQVSAVTRQELFLVALFFLAIILVPLTLIIVALSWNKVLAREVNLKTEELLESQERLVRSERFAAVGEAAAYVSHEIKNPLMVIGGLARQVQNKLEGPLKRSSRLSRTKCNAWKPSGGTAGFYPAGRPGQTGDRYQRSYPGSGSPYGRRGQKSGHQSDGASGTAPAPSPGRSQPDEAGAPQPGEECL